MTKLKFCRTFPTLYSTVLFYFIAWVHRPKGLSQACSIGEWLVAKQSLSRVTLKASMKKKKMVRKSQTSPNQNQRESFFSFQSNFLTYTNRPFKSWSIMTRTCKLMYLWLILDRYVGPNWCLLSKWSSLFWRSLLAYFVIRKLPSLLVREDDTYFMWYCSFHLSELLCCKAYWVFLLVITDQITVK